MIISQDSIEKKHIQGIHALVSVTQSDFQIFYYSLLLRFYEWLLKEYPNKATEKIVSVLDNTMIALKRRRAYLLPFSVDCEPSFQEEEEWTYAVFTAALFKALPFEKRLKLVKQIMPEEGYLWIWNSPHLYETWKAYLLGEECPILSLIIDNVKPNVTKSSAVMPESSSQALDLNNFLSWVQHGILHNSIPCNTKEAVLHGVEEGVFILIPEAIDLFFQEIIRESNIHEKSHIRFRLQRKVLEKSLRKKKDLIRDSQGSRIHHFYLGRWEERQRLSGVIAPWDSWQKAHRLPIHSDLMIDPITQPLNKN